mmetsp:Transcript_87650/g.225824  ORF Transcript_87650/g.225824 Transcript_87650/m.225824 type:complete len:203 (-) Transcript_87650:1199-1807(-)
MRKALAPPRAFSSWPNLGAWHVAMDGCRTRGCRYKRRVATMKLSSSSVTSPPLSRMSATSRMYWARESLSSEMALPKAASTGSKRTRQYTRRRASERQSSSALCALSDGAASSAKSRSFRTISSSPAGHSMIVAALGVEMPLASKKSTTAFPAALSAGGNALRTSAGMLLSGSLCSSAVSAVRISKISFQRFASLRTTRCDL